MKYGPKHAVALFHMYQNCKSSAAGHCKKWDYFQFLGGEIGDSQPHSVQPQCGEDYHEAAP
jgi:hypothetical protein